MHSPDRKNHKNEVLKTDPAMHQLLTIVNSRPPPSASPDTAATAGFLPSEVNEEKKSTNLRAKLAFNWFRNYKRKNKGLLQWPFLSIGSVTCTSPQFWIIRVTSQTFVSDNSGLLWMWGLLTVTSQLFWKFLCSFLILSHKNTCLGIDVTLVIAK